MFFKLIVIAVVLIVIDGQDSKESKGGKYI